MRLRTVRRGQLARLLHPHIGQRIGKQRKALSRNLGRLAPDGLRRVFADTQDAFVNGLVNGHLRAVTGNNGVFGPVGVKPTGSYRTSNYFRDVRFVAGPPPLDTQPPVVTNFQPADSSTVSGVVAIGVVFDYWARSGKLLD